MKLDNFKRQLLGHTAAATHPRVLADKARQAENAANLREMHRLLAEAKRLEQ